jgi:DNA-binding Xre family transcriptional regulator
MKRAWHEREKAKREKNEALAAAFREKRNKQKRDRLKQESAEARALRLERERFGYRKRVGVTRIATRAPGSSERVDAEPLRELLLSRFEHASDAALVTGLAQDTVRLVMNGIKAAVSIDTADQACLKLDVLLEDLYPYEENEAA